MKILISADMEGATGVTWPADVLPGTPQWERCRSMFTSDVNAAVLGFFDGGADEVVVNEAHWTMRNLLLERLDERTQMLTGRHKSLSMVEGVQHGDVDGIAFVGYHAGAGMEGVLAHTYLANSITGVWLNDVRASEGLLNAHVVAEYGVPVVLVTGDDVACEDALGYAPEALKVAVKDHVSRYAAVCRTPARTAADIRAAAKEAARLAVRHDRCGTVRSPSPWSSTPSISPWPPPSCPAWTGSGSARWRTPAGPCTRASVPSRRSPRSSRPRWRSSMADQQALDEVVRFTSDLIRIDTTNRGGGDCRERPAAEYAAEQLAGAGLEPVLLERTEGRTNVVARVEGSDPSADALLLHGHLDVVPAQADDWSGHPFSGEIRDGVVWGRGAVDMKNMDAMILAVVRQWAREGVRPRRDVVVAFTADEEDSARDGSGFLADEHPGLFEGCTEGVSESGAFTFHDGNGRQLYPIAAGERGTGWLKLTARGRAGHGSKVNAENAVTRLAAAVTRIGEHEWPLRPTPTVRAALTELAALYGIDGGLDDVDALLDKLGPAAKLVEATVRNSANPTMLDAGYKVNVIPGEAVAYVDGRYLPGGEDEFRATLDRLTGPDVDWEFHHREVALQAPVDSPTYARMRAAVEEFAPEGHVVPYCMSGGTDAKQFSRLGITGYGFTPLKLPEGYDYQAMFHGVDERVPVEALHFGVRVLDRFLRTA